MPLPGLRPGHATDSRFRAGAALGPAVDLDRMRLQAEDELGSEAALNERTGAAI